VSYLQSSDLKRVTLVSFLQSRVACRVSRVACRVSRVACRVLRVACRVSRRVSRVACRVCVECRVSDIECLASCLQSGDLKKNVYCLVSCLQSSDLKRILPQTEEVGLKIILSKLPTAKTFIKFSRASSYILNTFSGGSQRFQTHLDMTKRSPRLSKDLSGKLKDLEIQTFEV